MSEVPGETTRRRRYATAEALADDLHCFLAGEPIAARPSSTWERGLKWVKRRPTAAALLGVSAVAALALLAVVVLWLDSRKQPPSSVAGPFTFPVTANQLWQDSGVDVVGGQDVVLTPEGTWQKGQTESTAKGLESSSRDRAVLPDAPLMCLLVRVGDEATPSPLSRKTGLHREAERPIVFAGQRSGPEP